MGTKNNFAYNNCGCDHNVLAVVIPRQSSRPNAFGFQTGEILGSLKEGKNLFELSSLGALINLHARSSLNAIKLLGLSCFQNDI